MARSHQVAQELPGSTLERPFGPSWEVYKVRGKMFLAINEAASPEMVNVKCDPVDCRACLGLWLIVLVRRLCYCLQNRVRPRPASGTRAPSEDASDLCTRLDPGGNIVNGLASRGVHHWCGLFRSLRVAPADFRPGTRPAHPGPAHRRMSAVAFQVVGELGGGVLAATAWGWRIVFPLLVGHLRAAMSIASQTRTGAACCRPNRVPDCFPGAAAGDGRQVHEPLSGADIRDIAHPLHPGWLAVKSRLTRSGREPRSAAGTVVRTFRRGCAATRPCSRTGGCAPPRGPRTRAPAAAGPQGRSDAPVPAGFRPRRRAQS